MFARFEAKDLIFLSFKRFTPSDVWRAYYIYDKGGAERRFRRLLQESGGDTDLYQDNNSVYVVSF